MKVNNCQKKLKLSFEGILLMILFTGSAASVMFNLIKPGYSFMHILK